MVSRNAKLAWTFCTLHRFFVICKLSIKHTSFLLWAPCVASILSGSNLWFYCNLYKMQKLPNNFSFFRNSFVENKFCAVGWNTFTMYFTTGYKFCTLHSTTVYKFCTLHYYSTFPYHIQDAAYKFSPAQTAKDFNAFSHPFPIRQSKISPSSSLFKTLILELWDFCFVYDWNITQSTSSLNRTK